MTDRIIDILKELDISSWRVTVTEQDTAELYFVRRKLDMPRIKKIKSVSVDVFRDIDEDGGSYTGTANAVLEPGMDDEEIQYGLQNAWQAAAGVKNPHYDLPVPLTEDHKPCVSDLKDVMPGEAAVVMAKSLFEADTDEEAFINSAEIFAIFERTEITASNGLHVSFDSSRVEGELVAQCLKPEDVEQYRSFEYDRLDTDSVKELVRRTLEEVKARARSSSPPAAGSYDVLLKGSALREVLSYYTSRSDASIIYPGYSSWNVGMDVQGESGDGEKLDIDLIPSAPYSAEGIPMVRRKMLEKGFLKTIKGTSRYCQYLGVEPTGYYRKIFCGNGSMDLADMCKEGVLEPVTFSDFQMDFFDGHFKGEIRLAYLYHEDGTVEELTGGSINGCLTDIQGELRFSKERYSDASYEGPLACLFPGVPVAGA